MGKNKWYTEMDGGPNPAFRASDGNGASRHKKSSSLPGLFVGNSSEDFSFAALWKATFKRFRRKWLSLKFRGNQVSGQAFNKKTVVKSGSLAVATYFIFGQNAETSAFINSGNTPESWVEETTLGVGAERKKTAPTKVKKAPKSDAAPVSSDQLERSVIGLYSKV